MNTKTICCVAGKSGGHIIPCLTIVQNNQINNAPANILFFSANTPLDKTILTTNKMVSWHVMLPLSSRAGSYIKLALNSLSSFVLSFFYLCKYRPQEIITTGGIVAIPTCLAGFILRIPITLYSLDALPGKAIQALTPLATSIITPFATSTKHFPAQKCSVAPYPIKYQPAEHYTDTVTAQKKLGLSPHKKTVLVLGGSQGSLFLNQCMQQWTNDASFTPKNIQIIHQTGAIDDTDWQHFYASKNITAHAFSYYPDLALMYAAADLIICRAGAGTLFEIKFFNKKCIIIPLSTHTTDHQIYNARAMSHEYSALFHFIAQKEVEKNPTILFATIQQLLHSP